MNFWRKVSQDTDSSVFKGKLAINDQFTACHEVNTDTSVSLDETFGGKLLLFFLKRLKLVLVRPVHQIKCFSNFNV